MKALLQRVSRASVTVDDEVIARIDRGLLVLVGVVQGDTADRAAWLAGKTLSLRIFPDADAAMNRSVVDVTGDVLVVSQFTLAADTSRGNRPGFSDAADPEDARKLYEHYLNVVRESGLTVAAGRFGADMQVELVNDGPVTILLDCVR